MGTNANETFNGAALGDQLNGAGGNDVLNGLAGNDTLIGGTGNDTLTGGTGNDVYVFGRGDGQDVVQYEYSTDTARLDAVRFGAGISQSDIVLTRSEWDLMITISGTADSIKVPYFFWSETPANSYNPVQQLQFADGSVLSAQQIFDKVKNGPSLINGTAGNDYLNGTTSNDQINGGAGHDNLNGGNGNDTLAGGTGNDSLTGGLGNDTYTFGRGDGQDVVQFEYSNDTTRLDAIRFGTGITQSDLVLTRNGSDLTIGIVGTTDSIKVPYFFWNETPVNTYNPVQQLQFADGSVMSAQQVFDKVKSTPLVISGTAGNDYLFGTTFNDAIEGGAGNDYMEGGNGNDKLTGDSGSDNLNGGAGNDTLIGGTGNDTLTGGLGNDTYTFGRGDGQDVVQFEYSNDTTRLDAIRFGAGITQSDLVLTRSGSDLTIGIVGTTDSIKVPYFFWNETPVNTYNPVQQLQFADGSVMSAQQVFDKVKSAPSLISGTAGNDYLYGTTFSDAIEGGAGNDHIEGGNGNDKLTGDAGNDNLNGGAGNDTLIGGTGNDIMTGGLGNDTYMFGRGDGQDVVQHEYATDTTRLDAIRFGAGISQADVVMTRSEWDLMITISGTTDSIKVPYFFWSETPANSYNPVQQLQFADGSVLSAQQVFDKVKSAPVLINGTTGNDYLYGTGFNDQMNGGAGNDHLYGNNGNDTLTGGSGDAMYGGAGDDTIKVQNTTGLAVYGESGKDTLALIGNGVTLNLALAGTVRGIDVIDLNSASGTGNSLVLSAKDLLDTTDANKLYVHGSSSDKLTFNEVSGKAAKPLGALVTENGTSYRAYDTNADGANDLFVQATINQQLHF